MLVNVEKIDEQNLKCIFNIPFNEFEKTKSNVFMKTKEKYKTYNLVICILAVFFSFFGFSNLVNIFYPIFGILGLIQLLFVFKCK